MPEVHRSRSGSMQYWPRKRAQRSIARVRSWAKISKAQLLGFCGYKAGMTNITIIDSNKRSLTKGEKINMPVTIIECPPVRIASVRLYKKGMNGLKLVSEFLGKTDKALERKLSLPKSQSEAAAKLADVKPEDFDEVRVNVHTQPRLTGIGKKKPEYFEFSLGGKKDETFNYAKENLGKDIFVKDIFTEGAVIDIHAITKGKGFQGPVKRMGVTIRRHKSEKTKRGPGSLGGWCAQGHTMYRVAHAGQMGFHTRTEFNKQILKIGDDVSMVNAKGGFPRYGVVKNQFILIKGSVGGARKRLIKFNFPTRKNKLMVEDAPTITYISTESKQGR
jgi:large subunit ribosomal protein L3